MPKLMVRINSNHTYKTSPGNADHFGKKVLFDLTV